jgi:hypothetical protein
MGTRLNIYRTAWAIAMALAAGVLLLLGFNSQAQAKRTASFQVALAQGEIKGYSWALGVKGAKSQKMSEICALSSMIEPPRPDGVPVDGRDATDCGSLSRPEDRVSTSAAFAADSGRIAVFGALFRPIVRKVTFILETGERKVYRTQPPGIQNRLARHIPNFRFVVFTVEGELCVRRLITFDAMGQAVSSERRPACPEGGGNF